MSRKIKNIESSLMNVASTIGVGMLYVPFIFSNVGIIYGSLILFGVEVMTSISLFTLYSSAKSSENKLELPTFNEVELDEFVREEDELKIAPRDVVTNITNHTKKSKLSYPGLGSDISPKLGRFIRIMLPVSCLASCIFYLKFIAESGTVNLDYSKDTPKGYGIYSLITLLISIPLFCIAQVRDLSKLKWLGYLNVAIILIVGFCTLLLKILLPEFEGLNCQKLDTDFMLAIVTSVFAMSGLHNSVEIYAKLENKNLSSLIQNSIFPPLICNLLYTFVGIVGVSLLGYSMPNNDIISIISDPKSELALYIAMNHPGLVFLPYTMSIMVMIALSIAFIFNLAAVTRSLVGIPILKKYTDKKKQLISTSLSFILIISVVLIPELKMDLLLSLISDFFCLPLSFILPYVFSIFHLGKNNKVIRNASILPIIVSVVFIIFDTYKNISKIHLESDGKCIPVPVNNTMPEVIRN